MQTGEEPIVGEAPRKADELKSHAIDSLQGLKETRSDKEASLTQTDKRRTKQPDVERHKHSSTLSTIDCLMQTMRAIGQEQTDVISAVRWESETLI